MHPFYEYFFKIFYLSWEYNGFQWQRERIGS
jgi:hypothetical protein